MPLSLKTRLESKRPYKKLFQEGGRCKNSILRNPRYLLNSWCMQNKHPFFREQKHQSSSEIYVCILPGSSRSELNHDRIKIPHKNVLSEHLGRELRLKIRLSRLSVQEKCFGGKVNTIFKFRPTPMRFDLRLFEGSLGSNCARSCVPALLFAESRWRNSAALGGFGWGGIVAN